MTESDDRAQRWHQAVEGTWHGWPSIFDARGHHLGHVQAHRAIFEREGERLISVRTDVDCRGEARNRLDHPEHLLRVRHVDGLRVYDGIDFFGAGVPYGTLVLGNDYCLPWTSDNRVTVHVLPDGETQAYSTLLYQGPALWAVINGIYRLSKDYDANAETRARIDDFVAEERRRGDRPHILPRRTSGHFHGELEVYGPDQTQLGVERVAVRYAPDGLYRAEMTCELGELLGEATGRRVLRYERKRHDHHVYYEGPDCWGNAIGYGRALYTLQHVQGTTRRIRGREFLLDEAGTTSVVWEIFSGDVLERVAHGVLAFEPDRG